MVDRLIWGNSYLLLRFVSVGFFRRGGERVGGGGGWSTIVAKAGTNRINISWEIFQ